MFDLTKKLWYVHTTVVSILHVSVVKAREVCSHHCEKLILCGFCIVYTPRLDIGWGVCNAYLARGVPSAESSITLWGHVERNFEANDICLAN
jgi:hypothetical protein